MTKTRRFALATAAAAALAIAPAAGAASAILPDGYDGTTPLPEATDEPTLTIMPAMGPVAVDTGDGGDTATTTTDDFAEKVKATIQAMPWFSGGSVSNV